MTLGVEVRTRTASPARGAPVNISRLFVPLKLGSAVTTPKTVRSTAELEAAFTITRTGGAVAGWDYVDGAIREGVRELVVVDYDGVTITFDAALAKFVKELGPGQVAAPQETADATAYGKLQAHGIANNRFALEDVASSCDTVAEANTAAGLPPTTNEEYGFLCWPWFTAAPVTPGGSVRNIPASAAVAGLIARADALGNPNRAAAGRDFPLQFATGLLASVAMADVATLLDAGINTLILKDGVLQLYGFQTPVPESDATPFWQANAVRARMWLKERSERAGEHYMWKQIDGRGILARHLKTDLDAACLELYNKDGLYGETPQDAFSTDVGAAVNTESLVSHGTLSGVAEARFSLHTKHVIVELVSVPVTGRVAA